MDLAQFLNLLATSLGAVGSVYVLKSLISLTPDLSAKLAASYYDYSRPQIESLAKQRGESVAGAAAVILALSVAVVNAAIGNPEQLFPSRGAAVATAGIIVAALTAVMHRSSGSLARRHSLATRKRIVAAYVCRLVEEQTLQPSYIDSVRSYAKNLLGITIDPSNGRRNILVQAAAAAGCALSPDSLPPDDDTPQPTV